MIVYIDCETGGLTAGKNALLEVAAIAVHDQPGLPESSRWQSEIMQVQSERYTIHPKALEVNGLTPDQIAAGYCPKQRAISFIGWLESLGAAPHTFAAHNVAFDYGFIEHWLGNESFDRYFNRRAILCSQQFSKAYQLANGGGKSSLDIMRGVFGLSTEGAHRAMKDVEDGLYITRKIVAAIGDRRLIQ